MVEAFGYEIRCRIVFLFLVATLLALSPTVVGARDSPQRWTPTTDSTEKTDDSDHDNQHGMLPSDDGHLPFSRATAFDDQDGFYDCTCTRHAQSRDHPETRTTTNSGARIFYLVMVHNERTLRDGLLLFRAIRDARNTVVFHVDRKVLEELGQHKNTTNPSTATTNTSIASLQEAYSELHQEATACPCGSNVVIDSVHRVEWSRWSMNLPTLWGMQLAASPEYWGHWDVFVNLSGDTLPVYTPETIANVFERLKGINFVTSRSCETGFIPTNVYLFPSSWHKRVHYTHHERDGKPIIDWVDTDGTARREAVIAHFGSQWVALQPNFVSFMVTEMQRPDSLPRRYQQYLKHTGKVMTDETFLPTVLMHVAAFNQTLPKVDDEGFLIYNNDRYNNNESSSPSLPRIRYLRYERMDEHYPSAIDGNYPTHPRYDVPSKADPTLVPPRVWGPYYLGIYDLANVRESGALYMRKVSAALDANVYQLLPVDSQEQVPNLQWPARGVSISPLPIWEEEKVQLMKLAAKRAQQRGEDIPEHIQAQMKLWDQEDQAEEARRTREEDSEIEDLFPGWSSEETAEEDEQMENDVSDYETPKLGVANAADTKTLRSNVNSHRELGEQMKYEGEEDKEQSNSDGDSL